MTYLSMFNIKFPTLYSETLELSTVMPLKKAGYFLSFISLLSGESADLNDKENRDDDVKLRNVTNRLYLSA